MKKLICSLICAVLFSSARADVESSLATIEEYLGELVSQNNFYFPNIETWLQTLWQNEYVTRPVWGPFEEFLTSEFLPKIQGIYAHLNAISTNSELSYYALGSLPYVITDHLDSMNSRSQGFNVNVLNQDFTDLETYLENAVSSPLNWIYTQLQNGLNVHGTVSADFNFDYSRFNDVFSYYAAATGPSRFNLAYHKRYVWASHIYDPKKPIPEVVSVQDHGGSSYDFLGFIEQYCNGSLQNMESLQAGLVQVLGALRGDDAKTEEITDDFKSVESDSASQMTELRESIDFSKYNFEVSDELFRYEVFAIGDGSTQMPEFVSIGPFDLRGFGPEISTFGFSIDCREWRPFFELIRSCFTIIIYLLICTLALSICFLLWKVGAPCVRVLQNIFNF